MDDGAGPSGKSGRCRAGTMGIGARPLRSCFRCQCRSRCIDGCRRTLQRPVPACRARRREPGRHVTRRSSLPLKFAQVRSTPWRCTYYRQRDGAFNIAARRHCRRGKHSMRCTYSSQGHSASWCRRRQCRGRCGVRMYNAAVIFMLGAPPPDYVDVRACSFL